MSENVHTQQSHLAKALIAIPAYTDRDPHFVKLSTLRHLPWILEQGKCLGDRFPEYPCGRLNSSKGSCQSLSNTSNHSPYNPKESKSQFILWSFTLM
jgi:hypothetical protein